jgi:hypothetical protein
VYGAPGKEAHVHEESLRPGDSVTLRKGAPLPPDGKRRLKVDCKAKVIEVVGSRVKVITKESFLDDEDGSRVVAPYLILDLSYVYRVDD